MIRSVAIQRVSHLQLSVDSYREAIWSRGQTDIYEPFCEFVAPPRKKNLVTIFS